jgi:hypothetical protein
MREWLYMHPGDKVLAPAGMLLLCATHIFLGVNAKSGLSKDFSQFYAAAITVRQGQGEALYDRDVQRALQTDATPHLVFNHLAYEALIWVPLSLLPFSIAAKTWFAINIVLLLFIGILLHRSTPPPVPLPWLVVLFAFPPVFLTLILGQDSILLLLAYSLSLTAFRKGHLFLSGILLSLGLFKFHLLFPFVAVMAIQKKWGLISGFFVGACLLVLISFLIVGGKGFEDYIHMLTVGGGGEGIYPSNMPNLRGLSHLILEKVLPTQIIFAVVAGVSLLVLLWAGKEKINGVELFAAALLITVLCSFHIYSYDLLLLIIPIAVLLKRPSPATILVSVLLFLTPLFFILGTRGYLSVLSLGVLVLLVGWSREMRHECGEDSEPFEITKNGNHHPSEI